MKSWKDLGSHSSMLASLCAGIEQGGGMIRSMFNRLILAFEW